MVDPGLSIEVMWQDDDMVEIQPIVGNGRFSGKTLVYTTYEELGELANALSNFPQSVKDSSSFSAGTPDGYAYFSARFYCFDSVGHTAARIHLESNVSTKYRKEEKDKLELELMFEAESISNFANQLKSMVAKQKGVATLRGIAPYTYNI